MFVVVCLALLFLASVSLTPAVFADPSDKSEDSLTLPKAIEMPLEQLMMVSIATGTPRSIARAPAIATVITADEIKSMGAMSLDEVLDPVSGLHVTPSQLNFPSSVYSMRGIRSEFNGPIVLLRNGVSVTQSAFGGRVGGFRQPMGISILANQLDW